MATTIPDENTQAIAALTTSVALLQESLSAEVTARQTGDMSLKHAKADAEETSAALLALASDKADKAVTLEGYGITDAKIANGTITLGADSITPLTSHQSLDAYVNAASYDSNAKKILLKHDVTTVAEIDATAFIKDGMVSSVAISNGKLGITFNTDAGLEPIEIPLTDIFNPANYYDKTATNTLLSGKADRVANATSGNLAAIDSNGDLADSGMAIGDFAVAESLAPVFVAGDAYEVGDLCTSFDNDEQHKGVWLYKCILATDGSLTTWPETDPTHWALATVEDVLTALRTALAGKQDALSAAQLANIAAVPNKADASALRYTTAAQSVASDTIALSERTFNVLDATAYGDTNTVMVTLPAEPTAESGKVADVLLRVDTGATVPTLDFDETANTFIAADDSWATLEASSHNVFSFTSAGVTRTGGGAKRVWVVGRVTAALETGGV